MVDTPVPERPLDPQKLLRLANLAREVLEETRRMDPQTSTTNDLASLYGRVQDQLKGALPERLADELDAMQLDLPFKDGASTEEVRMVYSGLIGWLGGLFQGLQASILAGGARPLELEPGDAGLAGEIPGGPIPPAPGSPGLQPHRPADDRRGEGYL